MTLHSECRYACPKCGLPYIPYVSGYPCPRCATPASYQYDFVEEAVNSILFNLQTKGGYTPGAWAVLSHADAILSMLFDLFRDYQSDISGAPFPQFVRSALSEWHDPDYASEYVIVIATRVFERLEQRLREPESQWLAERAHLFIENRSVERLNYNTRTEFLEKSAEALSLPLQLDEFTVRFLAALGQPLASWLDDASRSVEPSRLDSGPAATVVHWVRVSAEQASHLTTSGPLARMTAIRADIERRLAGLTEEHCLRMALAIVGLAHRVREASRDMDEAMLFQVLEALEDSGLHASPHDEAQISRQTSGDDPRHKLESFEQACGLALTGPRSDAGMIDRARQRRAQAEFEAALLAKDVMPALAEMGEELDALKTSPIWDLYRRGRDPADPDGAATFLWDQLRSTLRRLPRNSHMPMALPLLTREQADACVRWSDGCFLHNRRTLESLAEAVIEILAVDTSGLGRSPSERRWTELSQVLPLATAELDLFAVRYLAAVGHHLAGWLDQARLAGAASASEALASRIRETSDLARQVVEAGRLERMLAAYEAAVEHGSLHSPAGTRLSDEGTRQFRRLDEDAFMSWILARGGLAKQELARANPPPGNRLVDARIRQYARRWQRWEFAGSLLYHRHVRPSNEPIPEPTPDMTQWERSVLEARGQLREREARSLDFVQPLESALRAQLDGPLGRLRAHLSPWDSPYSAGTDYPFAGLIAKLVRMCRYPRVVEATADLLPSLLQRDITQKHDPRLGPALLQCRALLDGLAEIGLRLLETPHEAWISRLRPFQTKTDNPVEVLLVQDTQELLDHIGARFQAADALDVQIVGTAMDGDTALAAFERLQPDIVVTCIRMPRKDGLALTGEICRAHPLADVVILSVQPMATCGDAAFVAGAKEYLEKPCDLSNLLSAIRRPAWGTGEWTAEGVYKHRRDDGH